MAEKYTDWYPRRVGKYRAATQGLTMREHGAFTLLLDEYYQTNQPLPANAERLHIICRAFTAEEQAAVQSVLQQFFVLRGDFWHNLTADEQIMHRQAISEKRSAAAAESHKNGARNRRKKRASANAGANADTETETSIKEKNKKEKFGLDDLRVEHVSEWLAEKRSQGFYRDIDEARMLEMFVGYCRASGKKYKDYRQAFQNSFAWNNAPKRTVSSEPATMSDRKRYCLYRWKKEFGNGYDISPSEERFIERYQAENPDYEQHWQTRERG